MGFFFFTKNPTLFGDDYTINPCPFESLDFDNLPPFHTLDTYFYMYMQQGTNILIAMIFLYDFCFFMKICYNRYTRDYSLQIM